MTLDFVCDEHGRFEKMFLENYQTSHPCPLCGKDAEQRWLNFPQMETSAFASWNSPPDPKFGGKVFTDRHQYYKAIDRAGRLIAEPGIYEDAKQNEKDFLAKEEKRVFDKLENHLRDLGSDEIHKRLKVDVAIHEATMRGDANAIKRMGGMTSLDEAYSKAQDSQIIYSKEQVKECQTK